MDKTATQSIQLIENEMVIVFIGSTSVTSRRVATESISVSQYKTNNDGVYFIHDKSFVLKDQLLNPNNEKKLFFVPYIHIAGMEIKLKTDDTVRPVVSTSNAATVNTPISNGSMG